MGRPRILSPHAGSTFMTDELLVTIDASHIGGYLGDDGLLLCLELHPALPRPTCYANYDLGSAEDQIFATVLNVSIPGSYTLETFVARTQGVGTAVLSTSRHQVYFTITSSPSCTPSLFPRKVRLLLIPHDVIIPCARSAAASTHSLIYNISST